MNAALGVWRRALSSLAIFAGIGQGGVEGEAVAEMNVQVEQREVFGGEPDDFGVELGIVGGRAGSGEVVGQWLHFDIAKGDDAAGVVALEREGARRKQAA